MLNYRQLLILIPAISSPLMTVADGEVPYDNIHLPLTQNAAAALAKLETGGKVLTVEEDHQGQQTIFRVKVLHNNGKVKVHRLDRDTGHNIE